MADIVKAHADRLKSAKKPTLTGGKLNANGLELLATACNAMQQAGKEKADVLDQVSAHVHFLDFMGPWTKNTQIESLYGYPKKAIPHTAMSYHRLQCDMGVAHLERGQSGVFGPNKTLLLVLVRIYKARGPKQKGLIKSLINEDGSMVEAGKTGLDNATYTELRNALGNNEAGQLGLIDIWDEFIKNGMRAEMANIRSALANRTEVLPVKEFRMVHGTKYPVTRDRNVIADPKVRKFKAKVKAQKARLAEAEAKKDEAKTEKVKVLDILHGMKETLGEIEPDATKAGQFNVESRDKARTYLQACFDQITEECTVMPKPKAEAKAKVKAKAKAKAKTTK